MVWGSVLLTSGKPQQRTIRCIWPAKQPGVIPGFGVSVDSRHRVIGVVGKERF